jgi:predicted methyltransferase MtxX (methanogen marker protein 4)
MHQNKRSAHYFGALMENHIHDTNVLVATGGSGESFRQLSRFCGVSGNGQWQQQLDVDASV